MGLLAETGMFFLRLPAYTSAAPLVYLNKQPITSAVGTFFLGFACITYGMTIRLFESYTTYRFFTFLHEYDVEFDKSRQNFTTNEPETEIFCPTTGDDGEQTLVDFRTVACEGDKRSAVDDRRSSSSSLSRRCWPTSVVRNAEHRY